MLVNVIIIECGELPAPKRRETIPRNLIQYRKNPWIDKQKK